MKSRREKAILAIAFIGILLSLYAISLHYSGDGTSLCDINDTVNCDKVNKSQYSVLFGVPVAILGLVAYLAVFLIMLKRNAIQRALAFTAGDFAQYFLFIVTVMFIFQAYLTSMEVFVLNAYCIACVLSQICTALLLWLAWKGFSSSKS